MNTYDIILLVIAIAITLPLVVGGLTVAVEIILEALGIKKQKQDTTKHTK